MSNRKFIDCEFNNHCFVVDAEGRTKEDALRIAQEQTDGYEEFTVDDVKEDWCAWRLGVDNYEFPDGAWWLGKKGKPGAFRVWVVG